MNHKKKKKPYAKRTVTCPLFQTGLPPEMAPSSANQYLEQSTLWLGFSDNPRLEPKQEV